MNFRLPLIAVLSFACLPLHAQMPELKKDKKKPAVSQDGWIKKIAHSVWPFGRKAEEGAAATPVPKNAQQGKTWKDLVPTIAIDPTPLALSEVRTMKVTLTLANHGKKLVQLEFPTTQRIEVLVKDAAGARIEQWSEDQAFQNEPTLVAINPNERLEYTATVATRDLKAGQAYTIEGFFPNYDQLRAAKVITPAQ
jgi:hypothetical protein